MTFGKNKGGLVTTQYQSCPMDFKFVTSFSLTNMQFNKGDYLCLETIAYHNFKSYTSLLFETQLV